jgi:hypothetical protein
MSDNVTDLPSAARFDPPSGDPFLDEVEVLILRSLAEAVEFDREVPLHTAVGMAIARTVYIRAQGRSEQAVLHHGQFIAQAMIAVRMMSARQRTKLRHPSRTRVEMQRLLDGESI